MSWVIVEINQGMQAYVSVVGPFETSKVAEHERARRHFDRWCFGPLMAHQVRSVVKEVAAP